MMVHPSRTTGQHQDYKNWIDDTVNSWIRLVDEPEQSSDKAEFSEEFRKSYHELAATVSGLVSFDELIASKKLRVALKYTQRIVVNAKKGKTPEIPWDEYYSFILVGGQALDRGFTVEGLTVTYMPRNLGTGNVDTVLQRARFFGYKRGYLNFCRLFLPEEVITAYGYIIQHEEDVRNRLAEYNVNNRQLNNWDREAVLNSMLYLTRSNVLFDRPERVRFGSEWMEIGAPHDTPTLIASNAEQLADFLTKHQAVFNARVSSERHLSANLSVKACLEGLLNKLKFTRESDSLWYTSLRGILANYAETNPTATCQIILMGTTSPVLNDWQPRIRSLKKGEISQLFQGRSPKAGPPVYLGDRAIRDNNRVTIQVHLLNLKETETIVYARVPTLAVSLPGELESHLIMQPTNHQ